jgi:glycosyltransferase involved in cell wall biosynthesis
MQGGVADHTAHLARHLIGLEIEVSILTSYKCQIGESANRQPIPPGLPASPPCLHLSARHPGPRGGARTGRWLALPRPRSRLARAGAAGRGAGNPQSPISNTPSPIVYPIITGWGLGCWHQISRFLDEHHPGVLHIQYQAAAFDLGGWVNWLPWWLRRRQARPRLVVTFHDLRVPYLFPKAGPLRWRSILALARYSDAVIVTNVEDEQTLGKALGIRGSGNQESGIRTQGISFPESPIPDSLTLIPLGSNVEPQPPVNYDRGRWRARLGMTQGALLLAYFGFLNESKGGEDLVLALDRLVRRGYDVRLLMVGGQVGDVDATNRVYADRVRSLVQKHGLGDRVYWTGHISPEEVSANLLAADVVVMPYRDGASFRRTTFIAALCHACPVVTTRPTLPLAELRDGDNVSLVPPRDVDALTEAIARLADDTALRHKLAAGAEALGQRFDWPAITRQTLDLYRRLGVE